MLKLIKDYDQYDLGKAKKVTKAINKKTYRRVNSLIFIPIRFMMI